MGGGRYEARMEPYHHNQIISQLISGLDSWKRRCKEMTERYVNAMYAYEVLNQYFDEALRQNSGLRGAVETWKARVHNMGVIFEREVGKMKGELNQLKVSFEEERSQTKATGDNNSKYRQSTHEEQCRLLKAQIAACEFRPNGEKDQHRENQSSQLNREREKLAFEMTAKEKDLERLLQDTDVLIQKIKAININHSKKEDEVNNDCEAKIKKLGGECSEKCGCLHKDFKSVDSTATSETMMNAELIVEVNRTKEVLEEVRGERIKTQLKQQTELQTQMKAKDTELDGLRQEIEEMNVDHNKKVNEIIVDCEAKIKKLEVECSEKCECLEKDVESDDSATAREITKNAELSAEIDKLKEVLKQVREEMNQCQLKQQKELQTQMKAKEKDLDGLKQKIEEMDVDHNKKVDEIIVDCEAKIKKLEVECSEKCECLQKDVESADSATASEMTKNTELGAEIDKLKEVLEQVREERNETQLKQQTELQTQMKAKEKDLDGLRQKIEKMDVDHNKKVDEINVDNEAKIKNLKVEYNVERGRLKKNLESADSAAATEMTKNVELSAKVDKLNGELEQMRKELTKRDLQIRGFAKKDPQCINGMAKEMATLRKEYKEATETLRLKDVALQDLSTRLSQEMGKKVSADEKCLENINIKNRPMNIAVEYETICTTEWLEAKEVLDCKLSAMTERKKNTFLAKVFFITEREANRRVKEFHSRLLHLFKSPVDGTSVSVIMEEVPIELTNTAGDLLRTAADATEVSCLVQTTNKCLSEEFKSTTDLLQEEGIDKYVKASSRLAWKMALQRPPMQFAERGVGESWQGANQQDVFWDSADPEDPTSKVDYFVHPSLWHGNALMVKGRVYLSSNCNK